LLTLPAVCDPSREAGRATHGPQVRILLQQDRREARSPCTWTRRPMMGTPESGAWKRLAPTRWDHQQERGIDAT